MPDYSTNSDLADALAYSLQFEHKPYIAIDSAGGSDSTSYQVMKFDGNNWYVIFNGSIDAYWNYRYTMQDGTYKPSRLFRFLQSIFNYR